MSKSVEDKMKNAIESWEEKYSDVGFDKALVWKAVQTQKKGRLVYLNWYRVAVVVILLLMTWGWGNSYFANRKLQHEKVVMVGNIQTLGDEIKQLQQTNIKTKVVKEIVTDTVIKEVIIPTNKDSLLLKYQKLEKENREILTQLATLNEQLKEKDSNFIQLTNNYYALSEELETFKNQDNYDLAVYEKDLRLKVNEEALNELSQKSKAKESPSSSSQQKMKFVIFNKPKPSNSKAPAKRGIRL